MRSESVRALILGLALVAGCKPEPHRPDAAPPWWKPAPGEAADWDIQLTATTAAPFSISAPRAMYALDLWDVVPAATTLDYGDGKPPLAVPAGALATAIADLHTRTPPAIVVCHVGAGSIRLDDPDASKFPGYEATPPNRPTPPAASSVIGWSTTAADANERFIDIHTAARATVLPLIGKRIELAKDIGCDAIAVKGTDLPAYQAPGEIGHGFPNIAFVEYQSWSEEMSSRAHDLIISIGIRNKTLLGADSLAATYDWTILEGCGDPSSPFCDMARPYLTRNKAVFEIEYSTDENDQPRSQAVLNGLCTALANDGIQNGIIKSAELSSAYYMRCP
jgi:hypothetical protein